MADIDLYSGLSPLPSLAGGYRMGVGSAANAGGYAPVSWFAYRDAAGNYVAGGPLSCAAGTAALPSISFTGDLNTGLYRPAGDAIGFSCGGAERARLTTIGIGLGTIAPYAGLEIVKPSGSAAIAFSSAAGPTNLGTELISIIQAIPAAQARAFIGIGDSAVGVAGDLLIAPRTSAAASIRFFTGATGGVERMRLDSVGRVGIGIANPQAKLDIVETNAGSRLIASFDNSAAGDAWITLKGGDYTGNLRAFGSTYATAPLQNFFGLVSQAGKNVGLLADTGDVRLFAGTFGTERFRVESGGTVRPGADNTQTLGAPASRWSVVYAGTGTINTSDARDKTWRGALTAAELAAAKRIAAELGFYQLNDSIAVKGAEHARYHVGVRAQAVWAIMADEGLVDPLDGDQCPGATPYAFLCWDEWDELTEPEYEDVEIPAVIDDQTGEEIEPARTERQPTGQTIVVQEARARFGIRECQLALFLIAAQEARLAALEAAL